MQALRLIKRSVFVSRNAEICRFDSSESWVILSPIEQSIKHKIERAGTPLKDWDINIYRGVLTGFNEAFIISGSKREEILAACKTENERLKTAEIIRPILRGRDIKRYSYTFANQYIIATFPSRHYNIEDFPSLKNYFLSIGIERLEQSGKTHVVNGKKIKSRKKTNNKWFETQDSISYWEDFFKQKIVWGNLNLNAQYCFVEEGIFINAPSSMIVPAERYLLAILNSSLADYYIRMLGVTRNGGYFEYKPMFVEKLPVPVLTEKQKRHLELLIERGEWNAIDEFVFSLYRLDESEIVYMANAKKKEKKTASA
ncbi:MAG: TaqI-like C-terminal specificity domain-containing protein [Candidatus Spyradosoma sp.]